MNHIVIILFIAFGFTSLKTGAQGCVAIRSNGNTCSMNNPSIKGWQFNLNTRYFKSFKHFVGTIEQKERVENGTEVINHSLSWDMTLTRTMNNRWSFGLNIPVLSNVRSSLYEHGGNSGGPSARHKTRSFGLGDARFTVYRWLFNPAKSHKGNIQAGLGLKLPTGDYRYQDFFYKLDGSHLLGPVDQSIQLGDGGTGLTAELNAFYNLSHTWNLYSNLYYLVNPREQNGVSTARGGSVSASALKYFTSTMSVPDQYLLRGGVSYQADQFIFSGGLRAEGIPSGDLIGGDKGFRRPGYIISAEPVIVYQLKKMNLYVSAPVSLRRNRTQSYADKLRTAETGIKVQGDAAFSDYAVNAGLSVRF